MRMLVKLLIVTCAAIAVSASAQAQVINGNISYTATPDSTTALATNLVNLGTSSSTGFVSQAPITFQGQYGSTANVSFSGSSGLYNGGVPGIAAAPQLAGTAITTNYLVAEPNGAVTISYTSPQTYFGLNWGSVDAYNTLTFYNNGVQVASLSGSQFLNNGFGFTTERVAFNFNNGSQFTSVIARSTSPAFEFAVIQPAYKVAPTPATGSTPLGALVAGLMLWLMVRNRRDAV